MRSKIFFILAIVMGLITTVLFYNYMNQVQTEVVSFESTKEVVVAKTKITKNQRITSDMIELRTLPEAAIHGSAVYIAEDVAGNYATSDIEIGEMVLSHRISNEKEEAFIISRKIANGYRAVSVGLNYVQSVSNLILPSDYVDVIVSEQITIGEEKTIKTEMILQKAKVLAIGSIMLEPNEGEQLVEYTSVTLELVSSDAVILVNASERGQIQLILHSRIMPPKEAAKNEQST